MVYTHYKQIICITFIQYWTNVDDVGPTLYECYANVLCLLGNFEIFTGSVSFVSVSVPDYIVASRSKCFTF